MKRKIERNKKFALAGILIVLICTFIIKIILLLSNPGSMENKVNLYSYYQQAGIAYNIGLKPNNLYDSSFLGEGMVYLSQLVDSINATFNYQFKGESEADLKGDYEIVGILEGYQGEKDSYKILWTKRYVLQAKTSFTAKNNVYTISSKIPVAYNDYRTFADNLAKELYISANVKLTVQMNVHLQAVTEKGLLEENLSPGLVMSLNAPYFEITKNQDGMKTGAIQQTEKTMAPVNLRKLLGFGLVLVLTVAALIYLLLFTSVTVTRDFAEKKLKKIYKKYGNRMVALRGFPETVGHHYEVKSIEDLIKLSDETGRPVFYRYQEDAKEINRFYIVDQDVIYYWNTWWYETDLTNSCCMSGGVDNVKIKYEGY